MKLFSFIPVLSLCLLAMFACKKEKLVVVPTAEKAHDVSSVSGPTSGSVNTEIVLTVTYPYANGCDYIERFDATRSGNTITLRGISKPVPPNAVCTLDAGSRNTSYSFTPGAAGTYLLRFLKANGSSVDHSIVVQ